MDVPSLTSVMPAGVLITATPRETPCKKKFSMIAGFAGGFSPAARGCAGKAPPAEALGRCLADFETLLHEFLRWVISASAAEDLAGTSWYRFTIPRPASTFPPHP